MNPETELELFTPQDASTVKRLTFFRDLKQSDRSASNMRLRVSGWWVRLWASWEHAQRVLEAATDLRLAASAARWGNSHSMPSCAVMCSAKKRGAHSDNTAIQPRRLPNCASAPRNRVMPYELRRLNRFLREFDKLTSSEQQEVLRAVETLIIHLNSHQPLPKGLGIKKLTRHHWEVRAGLSLRIIYDIEAGFVRLITVGNHNDVERFLRNL